jgi:tRNA U34 5-carboxymethylaminomethyl modifying GTPase MnmE/TrmE
MASWQPYECAVLELRSALSALSEMLGEEVEEEILDRVFSQFCIGK